MIALISDFLAETDDRRFPAMRFFRQLRQRVAGNLRIVVKTVLSDPLLALGKHIIIIFNLTVNRHKDAFLSF